MGNITSILATIANITNKCTCQHLIHDHAGNINIADNIILVNNTILLAGNIVNGFAGNITIACR
jgi:hypothetical protein